MERSCEVQELPGKNLINIQQITYFKKVIEHGVKNDSFKHFAEDKKEANWSITFNEIFTLFFENRNYDMFLLVIWIHTLF